MAGSALDGDTALDACAAASGEGAALDACASAAAGDFSLLVHRAAQGLRVVLDRACREQGLNDGRDWLVLTALSDGTRRTQLELARLLGIDKTTLIAVLDRLERLGLVVRRADPADRRARIPESTPAGREVWGAVARARDDVERAVLGGVPRDQHALLRDLLVRLAAAGDVAPVCLEQG